MAFATPICWRSAINSSALKTGLLLTRFIWLSLFNPCCVVLIFLKHEIFCISLSQVFKTEMNKPVWDPDIGYTNWNVCDIVLTCKIKQCKHIDRICGTIRIFKKLGRVYLWNGNAFHAIEFCCVLCFVNGILKLWKITSNVKKIDAFQQYLVFHVSLIFFFWWLHVVAIFSLLLALWLETQVDCPHKGSVMRSLDDSFVGIPNKPLNKQSSDREFETYWPSCDTIVMGMGICRPRFNIKMPSYQYRKSHCGDKTVVRSSYLHNGISNTSKMTSLYWISSLGTVWMSTPSF